MLLLGGGKFFDRGGKFSVRVGKYFPPLNALLALWGGESPLLQIEVDVLLRLITVS